MCLHIVIHTTSDVNNLIPSFSGINFFDDFTLEIVELNNDMRAHLKPKIYTVNKIEFVQVVEFLDAEEIAFIQRSISTSKGLGESRELALDKFLDASIFDDVQKIFELLFVLGDLIMPPVLGGVQSMTHFVTREQIVKIAVHVLPYWKNHRASLEIKICGLDVLVRDRDILGSQKFGENRFGRL